ncbi:MAG: hypothetical protein AAGJ82_09120, partial [Bacteroidota bacterium]
QEITIRKPTIADINNIPDVVEIPCGTEFAMLPNGNPIPDTTGLFSVTTFFGTYDILGNASYCNLGASFSDSPVIVSCDVGYKFNRTWTVTDKCDVGAAFTFTQLVKITDTIAPILTCPSYDTDGDGTPDNPTVFSLAPNDCTANFIAPLPSVTDNCSSNISIATTIFEQGTNAFVAYVSPTAASRLVTGVPVGQFYFRYEATDDCGNTRILDCPFEVRDLIEPYAVCDDELNVSLGGGDVANGIEGIARIFATDVDEGSSDNCGVVTLEVRRNFWADDTCSDNENSFSPWGDFIDFLCCDIDREIKIELRVTDASGNQNICWMVITPEDKINPTCFAPADQTLTCQDLPLTFPGDLAAAYATDFAGTSLMMDALFGAATGTDNCAMDTIIERSPQLNLNECGWGTIRRSFRAWQLRPDGDASDGITSNEVFASTNTCVQVITITEVHDFVIDFPEDDSSDCGEVDPATVVTETVGCDVFNINIGDQVRFEATGDECYKYSVTYDVINWCVWDGEYEGLVLPRITEDDGESLAIDRSVEEAERPIVSVETLGVGPIECDPTGATTGVQYVLIIDRSHDPGADGDSSIPDVRYDNIPGNQWPCIPADQFGRRNYGRYIYTQFVKVFDTTVPVVTVDTFGGPTINCPDLAFGQFGDDDGDCQEEVAIRFSVDDDCELFDNDGNLVVSIVSAELDAFAVDANNDGEIKANEFVSDANVMGNITSFGDGDFVFEGTFPIITSAMGDNIVHAVRVLVEDGCGNQSSVIIDFDVVDCKGPAPVCINGLTVTLMPTLSGDGCEMAIWASDFEGSPITDCTGQDPDADLPFSDDPQVTSYAIYRAAFVEAQGPDWEPSPDDTGLVLNQDDDNTTIVYVYAFDEEGNYDYCETYILVQAHENCPDADDEGTIAGVIATENDVTVEHVEVNLSGSMANTMTTTVDGAYSFTNLNVGGDYTVTPYNNSNHINGVTTFDIVKISKHILAVQPLDSPYKRIAADANRSNTITTLDLIQIRKLILNVITEFSNNTSWRFVEGGYNFPNVANPWAEEFPEVRNFNNLNAIITNADFVAIKIGDVNGSAIANAQQGDDRTLNGRFDLEVDDMSLNAGNTYTVSFRGRNMATVEGYQATLALNGLELVDIEYGVAQAGNFGLRYASEGMITTSWNQDFASTQRTSSEDVLFSLVVRATEDIELHDALSISSRYTVAEAYRGGDMTDVGIHFVPVTMVGPEFALYQNVPNPFQVETFIGFNLPEDAEVTLTVTDVRGRVLYVINDNFAAGYNKLALTRDQIKTETGVLTYTLTAGEYTATKQMVVVR